MRVMAAAVEETEKSLRELTSDDFYPFIENAGERLVVVDFYTDWWVACICSVQQSKQDADHAWTVFK